MENLNQENVNSPVTPAVPTTPDPVGKADVSPGVPNADGSGQKPSVSPTSPISNGSDAQPGNNDILEKRVRDLQAKWTKAAQDRAEYARKTEAFEKQISQMNEVMKQLTKKPYNPEQFLREFEQKGPEALFPHFEEKLKEREANWMKQVDSLKGDVYNTKLENAYYRFKLDATNYPDFGKLEPTMKEIVDDPESSVDFSKSPAEILEQAYKLAKERHMQDAVQAAHLDGKKSAEKELANEAKTAVAGGGKSSGPAMPDTKNMTADKIREMLSQFGAVVDRD
jgi:hypothetical protein